MADRTKSRVIIEKANGETVTYGGVETLEDAIVYEGTPKIEPTKAWSVGQLTIDLDCSDALTGLKAIQREAKKATQALRELEETTEVVDYARTGEVERFRIKMRGYGDE